MHAQIDNESLPSCTTLRGASISEGCLYCGCDDFTSWLEGVRDRLSFVPGSWRFLRCESCGSAILSPLPQAAELADLYPPVYSFAPDLEQVSVWRQRLARLEYLFAYRTLYERDVRRILQNTLKKNVAGKSVLDIGCGRGYRLPGFQRRGCRVTGTDFQPALVKYVQTHWGIPAVCCGTTDMDRHFAPQTFDLVTAFYVLEHVLDVKQTLQACHRLLKPGGWFAAAVPLLDGLHAGLFGPHWSQVTEAPRHVSLPSRKGIRRSVEQVGFRHVRLIADSLVHCAAAVGLSLVPAGTTFAAYGAPQRWQVAKRLLAATAAAIAVPWCLWENVIVRQPSLGIVIGQKVADGERNG